MNTKYQGIIIPAITPLTADHQLDQEAVEKIFANFRNYDVKPFILGTTGEASSLPPSVKQDYIKLAGKLKKPGDIIYAGIASNCLEESVELAKICAGSGIDVVAAHLPSYYSLSENQMMRYFETLADKSDLPLIIYNIPATTHMSVPVSLIDKLSRHENIVGVKDSERSEERLKESLQLWAGRADFSYFLGWAAKSAEALSNGADGLIPSTGNLYPRVYQQMLRSVNNKEELFRLQNLSDHLGNLYQQGRLLGESLWALKVLMQEEGLCKPFVMPPLTPLSKEEENRLLNNYKEFINEEKNELKTYLSNV